MEYEKYKVIISEKAKNMLASNIAFIAKVSADAATKQKKAVIDGIRSLEQMPKRYPFFNEEYIPPNKYRKMFIKKWYLILYKELMAREISSCFLFVKKEEGVIWK